MIITVLVVVAEMSITMDVEFEESFNDPNSEIFQDIESAVSLYVCSVLCM